MRRIRIVGMLLALSVAVVRAEDWTTVDGNTYKNVRVLSHDDGYVTILDDDGGAKIMLSELPSSIRVRFGFDPAKACACVAASEAQDAKDAAAVEQETASEGNAEKKNPIAVVAKPVAASTSPSTKPAELSDAERQEIENQIGILKDDVTHLKRQLNSDGSERQNSNYTIGGCEAKVEEEQRQIQQLQNELQSGVISSGSDSFSSVPRL